MPKGPGGYLEKNNSFTSVIPLDGFCWLHSDGPGRIVRSTRRFGIIVARIGRCRRETLHPRDAMARRAITAIATNSSSELIDSERRNELQPTRDLIIGIRQARARARAPCRVTSSSFDAAPVSFSRYHDLRADATWRYQGAPTVSRADCRNYRPSSSSSSSSLPSRRRFLRLSARRKCVRALPHPGPRARAASTQHPRQRARARARLATIREQGVDVQGRARSRYALNLFSASV